MSDKFEFIDAENAVSTTASNIEAPSIVKMCAWLEISEELKLFITRAQAQLPGSAPEPGSAPRSARARAQSRGRQECSTWVRSLAAGSRRWRAVLR